MIVAPHPSTNPSPSARPRRRGRTARNAAATFTRWWFTGVPDRSKAGERGQGTVEYALVLLGAAAVALALVAWVMRSDAVSRLFDAIVGRILSQTG